MTGLGEMTSHSQLESNVETPKETSKGANGETGVAGNTHSSKNDRGLKGEGCQVDEEKGTVQEKKNERLNERDRELSHAQATKASRRTASLLNLFMSNSQGRFSKSNKIYKTLLFFNCNSFYLPRRNVFFYYYYKLSLQINKFSDKKMLQLIKLLNTYNSFERST